MVNARIHAPDRIERCEVTVKYRKKPVVIEAIKWTGKNVRDVFNFLTNYQKSELTPTLEEETFRIDPCNGGCQTGNLIIKTLEGEHIASIGDWIIKGIQGEFYPCKPDIFEATYTIVSDYFNFGWAIEAAKSGAKISRQGWNGKGMFVVYQKGYPQGIASNKQTAQAWGMKEGDLFRCEPYLQIQMVNGSHSMWVPSVNDVLAEDWTISV